MFIPQLFLVLISLNLYSTSQDIQVVHSGMSRLQRNDMMVVFFVTIKNFGRKPRKAMADLIECCEQVSEADNDCDLMDLFGGDFGIIHPNSLKNLTFIFPSLYGYNRKGHCSVKILHRGLSTSDVVEIQHQIDFDTSLTTDAVPSILKGLYDPESLIACETPDLDPLDHCNPVDCHLKYGGHRNFFNHRLKMCQRVPVCLTDPKKDLPDIVYIPGSNKCQNLENPITQADIERLAKGTLRTEEEQLVNIRCHHGEIDPRTGLCVCDYGWKSEPFIPGTLNSDNLYSMCTIKCHRDEAYEYLPFWVGFILAMWWLFFVSLCEWNNLFLVRRCHKPRGSARAFPNAFVESQTSYRS